MARRSRGAVKAAVAEAQALLAQPKTGDHLGDLLWWDFTTGFRESSGIVAQAWSDAGLTPSADLPPPPDWGTAFSRAIEAAAGVMREADYRAEDCAPSPDGSRRVAMFRRVRNGSVTGETRGIVVLPKNGGPFVETNDPHGFATLIANDTPSHLGVYRTDDMRAAVITILDRYAATPCRQTRPHIVYWLPSHGSAIIRRVRTALQAVRAGTIQLSPMHDDADSRTAAAAAANAGLEARLNEFHEEIAKWKDAPPGRVSTIESRLSEAEKLRRTGELYKDILGEAVASIDARINDVNTELLKVLGIVEVSKEEKRARA